MAWSSARRGLVGVVVVAAAVLVSATVYPRLPERMVTHWGATGEPNRWIGRFWGAFFVPALAAAPVAFAVVPVLAVTADALVYSYRRH